MAKIREKDRNAIMNAIAGGVTPRQGIQHIQVGRKEETEAILRDLEQVKAGGGAVRIISAGYGSGKKLPLETPVLTEKGWKANGELTIGDKVYTRNGELTEITFVSDKTLEDVYEIELADGRVLECCKDHQWFVYDENNVEKATTVSQLLSEWGREDLVDNIDCNCECENDDDTREKTTVIINPTKTYWLPNISALQYHSQEYEQSPYEMGKTVYNETKTNPGTHIPIEYLYGSVEQRKELLKGILGLNITENIPSEKVDIHLGTSGLSYEIIALVRSLGGSAFMRYDEKDDCYDSVVECDYHSKGVKIVNIKKTPRRTKMQCIAVADDTHSYIIGEYTLTHNTFFLTLAKTVALKQNMMVITADLSPDRRLYSTSGQALNLYREEMRSLSTPMHPDGGALEELLDAIDEKVMSGEDISEFRAELQKLPYGYDAWTVCQKWHQSKNPITKVEIRDANMLQDACLRWFAGECTTEQKRMLQVRNIVGDDGAWDMLKLIAILGHFAGYAGLMVELDECVNLYKINNTLSRDRNYEQILRIFNECLQGQAKYLCCILAGTPEFSLDPSRGLSSYSALASRIQTTEYSNVEGSADTVSPLIDLLPISIEDQLVLLGNLTNVEAYGAKEDWLVTDTQMRTFLEQQYTTLGSEIKSPREITRAWVALLRTMREHPELTFDNVMGENIAQVKPERKTSGLGAIMDDIQPNNSVITVEEAEEENFGF